MRTPRRSAAARSAPSKAASTGRDRNSAPCSMSMAPKISSPMNRFAPDRLPVRLHRRGELFGPVPFRHVDDGLHRSGEFIHITHIGKIPLRYASKCLRCDAIEQDYAEIAVLPPGRGAGVELFPTKMERRVGILSGHVPMRDDVRVLADQI